VLGLDPSNSGLVLGFENFGWNPSFLVKLSCDLIPGDLVHLRCKFWGIASTRDASLLPQIMSQELKSFGRSMDG
jgi:hypothetical protein